MSTDEQRQRRRLYEEDWKERNRARFLRAMSDWRKANPERARAAVRRWCQDNSAQVAAVKVRGRLRRQLGGEEPSDSLLEMALILRWYRVHCRERGVAT